MKPIDLYFFNMLYDDMEKHVMFKLPFVLLEDSIRYKINHVYDNRIYYMI